MHNYYGRYLEKIKSEIDRLIIAEVEGANLSHANEETIEMLVCNYEGIKCLLHKEMAKGAE